MRQTRRGCVRLRTAVFLIRAHKRRRGYECTHAGLERSWKIPYIYTNSTLQNRDSSGWGRKRSGLALRCGALIYINDNRHGRNFIGA
jgi:hypothetical protein